MFVAVGDAIWDNGAACGRTYEVRCFSGVNRPCKSPIIRVKVIDHRNIDGRQMALSTTAYDRIADRNKARSVTIEYSEFG